MKKIFLSLITGAVLTSCSGVAFSPSHYGKFDFRGTVKDSSGKPIPNAIVKVQGWETITNEKGEWSQSRILKCGALRDEPTGKKMFEPILITAEGYRSHEESFYINHPRWFENCEKVQPVVLPIVLNSNKELEKFSATEKKEIGKKTDSKTDSATKSNPSTNPTSDGGVEL